ncbi:MAG: DUF4430 domain-containing protein [Firmicutes bacterium]|nr:DUF4430 domain-containing protein [Bacillota bacterium]
MKNKKLLLVALLLIIVALAAACSLFAPNEEAAGSCELVISCETILANEEALKGLSADKKSLIPENGYIVAPISLDFYENETVLQLVQRFAQKERLHIDVVDGSYITGIGNIYGGDCGELSGWLFFVNGESSMVGANEAMLSDGDIIEFKYTCDMGADLGLEW